MSPRRKSVDSSDSSSSSDSDRGGHKKHKEKKDKKKKEKKDKDVRHGSGHGDINAVHGAAPGFPQFPTTSIPHQMSEYNTPPPHYGAGHDNHQQNLSHNPQHNFGGEFPSPGGAQYHGGGHVAQPSPPPSGYRIPLTTQTAFPTDPSQIGQPVFHDADGVSPVFIGSALLEKSVHPCKIGPHLQPFASVPYGGGEYGHQGRFDLLPYHPDQMEWVHTSYGRIPPGRRAVEGGYEENGAKLYHAAAIVNGVKVPGKTGEHLAGARVAFGGAEHAVDNSYEILCWR